MANVPFGEILSLMQRKYEQDRIRQEQPENNIVGALNTLATGYYNKMANDAKNQADLNSKAKLAELTAYFSGEGKYTKPTQVPNSDGTMVGQATGQMYQGSPVASPTPEMVTENAASYPTGMEILTGKGGTYTPKQKGIGTLFAQDPKTLVYANTGIPTGKEENIFKEAPKPERSDPYQRKEFAKAKAGAISARANYDVTKPQLDELLKLNEKTYNGKIESFTKKGFIDLTGMGTGSEEYQASADVTNKLKNRVVADIKSKFGAQLSDGEREYLNYVYGAADGMTRVERGIAIKNIDNILQAKLKQAEDEYSAWNDGNDVSQDNRPTPKGNSYDYATEADVMKNPPPSGTEITIGGRKAVWE